MIHNVNYLIYATVLYLCGYDMTWDHQGFSKAGAAGLSYNILKRLIVSKGGKVQTFLVLDLNPTFYCNNVHSM